MTENDLIIQDLRRENAELRARVPKWIPVSERLPEMYASVLGHMTDAGCLPSVRECYSVGYGFFFPALKEVHPVDFWAYMPELPKEEVDNG